MSYFKRELTRRLEHYGRKDLSLGVLDMMSGDQRCECGKELSQEEMDHSGNQCFDCYGSMEESYPTEEERHS